MVLCWLAAVALDEYLIIVGGYNVDGIVSDAWKLDIRTFEWKALEVTAGEEREEPSPRAMFRSTSIGSNLFMFGGEINTHYLYELSCV